MTSGLFREVLLNTSRVIWPTEPARARVRVTVYTDSRLALTRMYLALISYHNEHEDAQRARFMAAMEDLTAASLQPDECPPELRHPPRAREIRSGLSQGIRRLIRALEVAVRLSDDINREAFALAAIRTAQRVSSAAPVRRQDVIRRTFQPVLPVMHLALPLVASRYPEVADHYPELAATAAPRSLIELVLSDRWAFQALDAAERWRQALPVNWGLIEVRAHWTRV